MMKAISAVVCATLVLGGCASVQRLSSYGMSGAQAQVAVGSKRMNVWLHPNEPALMLAATVADGMADGAVRGATLGLAGSGLPRPLAIDAAVSAWLQPTGCRATPVQEIGDQRTNFEATYSCPEGVDLRAIVNSQKASLMRGEPIRTP